MSSGGRFVVVHAEQAVLPSGLRVTALTAVVIESPVDPIDEALDVEIMRRPLRRVTPTGRTLWLLPRRAA